MIRHRFIDACRRAIPACHYYEPAWEHVAMQKSILLCDDEVHILRAAEIKFTRSGFDVRCATDGVDALAAITERCPDILVTDCQMPRMGGLELVRRIRETESIRHLPIIMLTAKGFELSHDDLLEKAAVAAVVAKPFSPRDLLRMVHEVIETGSCNLAPAIAAAV